MRLDGIETSAAPALGEPLGIEFANSRYAVRGEVREGLATTGMLAGWLRDHSGAFSEGLAGIAVRALVDADLAGFVRLRDAIRGLARHLVAGTPPPMEPLAVLNEAAAAAPSWPLLNWSGQAASVTEMTGASPSDAVRAALARSAIETFGGPWRTAVRACGGPGCVLFFVRRHPRREWCTPGCGNRARVSRHYERHRAAR